MTSHDDLAAVRELRAAQAEPSDLAVARTRQRVMSSLDGEIETSRPARRPMLAALASAGAALAIVVGLVVGIQVARGSGPATTLVQPGAAPSAAASPSLSPSPTAAARIDLSATPIQMPAGTLLYVRSSGVGYIHEMWLDPQGAIPLQIIRTDNGKESINTGSNGMDNAIAASRAAMASEGPSLEHPTPAYLNALPTDPAQLYQILKDQFFTDGAKGPRYDLIVKGSAYLLGSVEPILTPEVRGAFLAALALTPGATVDRSPRSFDGHSVYLVEEASSSGVAGLIVDTTSGRILGDFAGVGSITDANSERWTYAVVTAPGQRP